MIILVPLQASLNLDFVGVFFLMNCLEYKANCLGDRSAKAKPTALSPRQYTQTRSAWDRLITCDWQSFDELFDDQTNLRITGFLILRRVVTAVLANQTARLIPALRPRYH